MRFCTNCGKEVTSEASFCPNCGQAFETGKEAESTSANEMLNGTEPINTVPLKSAETPSYVPPEEKNKKSKKWIAVLTGILIASLISAHLILSSIYDPLRQIDAMNSAYNEQNKEAFFKLFTLKEGTIADAKTFYALVNEYGWSDLRDELTDEARKIKNNQPADIIYDKGEFISVTKKPAVLGLYHSVAFTIIPTTVFLEIPIAGTIFHFDGKEITTSENDEFIEIGQYIPGSYKWSYTNEKTLFPLADEGIYTIKSEETNESFLDIDWAMKTLSINSDLEDAIVYINDTSTKKKVRDLSEIYPARLDQNVTLHAVGKNADGKDVKSAERTADSADIYLPFDYIQEEQELAAELDEVRAFYKAFRSDYETAIYFTDFSYVDEYFKDGTAIRRDYAEFVDDHRNIPGYYYEFLLNDVTSLKSTGKDVFELYSFERFNYSSYEDEALRYDRKKKYIISNVRGQYYIDSITELETKKTKY